MRRTNFRKRSYMKTGKKVILLSMAISLVLMIAGCGKKLDGPLNGKWSYIHDTESVAFEVKNNGTAILDGKKYSCTYNNETISLTSKDGESLNLRYLTDGDDKFYLYKISQYEYQGEKTSDGIVGKWVDTENGRSSFEFTENGTFCEDSYIYGYYFQNEESGSVLFVYNDHYEDTLIFYSLDGNVLTVEYPWPMVKAN